MIQEYPKLMQIPLYITKVLFITFLQKTLTTPYKSAILVLVNEMEDMHLLTKLAFKCSQDLCHINLQLNEDQKRRFDNLTAEILEDEGFQSMKQVVHHDYTDLYVHSYMVAYFSYCYAMNHDSNLDVDSLVRGALLHDYYLYDWRDITLGALVHGFYHPHRAVQLAGQRFGLNKTEENIIKSHMWPITPYAMPLCREAWVVTLMDKICAVMEKKGWSDYGYEGFSFQDGVISWA